MNFGLGQNGRTISAIVLIAAGVFFLIIRLFNIDIFSRIWPIFVLAAGIVLLYFAFVDRTRTRLYATPGAVLTGVGVILVFQTVTGRWESWAYAWTLFPVFIGLAMVFTGHRTNDVMEVSLGWKAVRWGLIAFVATAVIFEVIIFNRAGIGSIIVPVVLILAGGALILTRPGGLGGGSTTTPPAPPPPQPPGQPPTA